MYKQLKILPKLNKIKEVYLVDKLVWGCKLAIFNHSSNNHRDYLEDYNLNPYQQGECKIKINKSNPKVYSELQILNRLSNQVYSGRQPSLKVHLYLETQCHQLNRQLVAYFKPHSKINNLHKAYLARPPIREVYLETNPPSSNNKLSLFSDQAQFRINKINRHYLAKTSQMIIVKVCYLNSYNHNSNNKQQICSRIIQAKINKLDSLRFLICKMERILVSCFISPFRARNSTSQPRLFCLEN